MEDPIADLKDLSNICDSVSMLVMDSREFEKYFGKIYAAVKRFRAQPHNEHQAAQLVGIACHLLEKAVDHHRSASATPSAVTVYGETVRLLLYIMSTDLRMNDSVYQEAKKTRLMLNALKACGIKPPGHYSFPYSSRYGSADENEVKRIEALGYARNNIEEFTRFVYNIACDQIHISDPFLSGPGSAALSLFEKVRSLDPGA